jgi:predicted nuclease of predicted toxin-antitoxin system
MRIAFQADNDLNARIIDAVLRLDPFIDFKTAAQAGFHEGTPDPEVLKVAAQQGRILVSHDRRTLPWHFASFIEAQVSPGVIVITQSLPVADAARWLHLIWEAATPEEYRNRIEIISQRF